MQRLSECTVQQMKERNKGRQKDKEGEGEEIEKETGNFPRPV